MNNQTWIWNRQTNMLVAKAGMEKPVQIHYKRKPINSNHRVMDWEAYYAADKEYNAHIATLPAPIAVSPEFAEAYKDKPEGWEYEEGKDFKIDEEDSHPDCLASGCAKERKDKGICVYACDNSRELAYPIRQEETQDALWNEVRQGLSELVSIEGEIQEVKRIGCSISIKMKNGNAYWLRLEKQSRITTD